jgi:N-acetylglutamate synthase-like GNAT family acetyltransferase
MRDTHEWQVRECDTASLPLDLLLQADPSEEKVRRYLQRSRGFVVEDAGRIVGVCVLMIPSGTPPEILNISVAESHQRRGIGHTLLQHVIDYARKQGAESIEVGTGSFGYQLTFYQKAEFRVVGVDRDFFVRNYESPIFEDGIQLRDMIRLEFALAKKTGGG